jgi:nitrogenase-stabilizing/protective protein
MSDNAWLEELEDLESAEDFLNYFDVAYDQSVVHVNRLHILQRFHDYLVKTPQPEGEMAQRETYRAALERAYEDFVDSDAQTQKVFKVFRMNEPQEVRIPVTQLITRSPGQ